MGVQIPAENKCGYLRKVAKVAKANAWTLKESLEAAADGIYSPTFLKGRIVISQSGSGQSGSFQIGDLGGWSQQTVAALNEFLIQLLDCTVEQGTPDNSDPDLIDALFAAMVWNLKTGNVPQIGIREQMGDFSGLNFPATSVQ